MITLENLKIEPLDGPKCSWLCKQVKIKLLKQKSLSRNKVNFHIDLEDNVIKTEKSNNQIGIVNLLKSIFKTEPEKFDVTSFNIKKIKATLVDSPSKPKLNLESCIILKKDKEKLWHGRCSISDGSISIKDDLIIKKINGVSQFNQLDEKNFSADIQHNFEGEIFSKKNKFFVSGKYDSKNKFLNIKNDCENFFLALEPDQNGIARYKINLSDNSRNLKLNSTGKVFLHNKNLAISGQTIYGKYFLDSNNFVLTKNGKVVMKCDISSKNKNYNGSIKYSFLHSLLPIQIRKYLLGNKGTINIEIENNTGKVTFKNGKIHVPENYNLITGFSAEIELLNKPKKLIILKNMIIKFYKGSAFCHRAIFYFDDKNNLNFFHSDLQLKNILINWKKDFFGFIDGNFILKKEDNLKVLGDVIIKKSLFKENIFSQTESNLLQIDLPIDLDINISNEQYLKIKTPFLQTQAATDLNIKLKNRQTPQIKGRIELRGGTITFPRNKLFISSGKIDFIPTQINNPMVNLLAKNRIKKYGVTLQVTGLAKSPTIFLESNPELTEEQIISLLFAGSENISLRSGLPTIIMQNLSTLILGSKKVLPSTTSFFQKITDPLKYIQITPNFTDQSGRGGVKGTINIDVNKQLHAQIQKNFTIQDDLAFHIEYFLSDDINIKAIKDHRDDIGGEVEFVFKT